MLGVVVVKHVFLRRQTSSATVGGWVRFLRGFSTRKGSWRGVGLGVVGAQREGGGELLVMVKRGWLLSEEHSTLHKRGHLSLHQLLSDSCAGKRQAIE